MKAVAAAYGTTWNICHEAVKATADPVLADGPQPVRVLGIDETRRGKAKWETCSQTGVRRRVDRWDTGLVDITGAGGLLVQINGRSAKPVTDWLDQREEAWKASIEFVAIDMSTTYANAAREALAHAKLIVDRFHLVKRANEWSTRSAAAPPKPTVCDADERATRSGSTGAGYCAPPSD